MSSTQPSQPSYPADPLPGFSWTAHPQGPGVTRVRLSGELDIGGAPFLGDALAEAARGSVAVILDLSQLTFMDSRGLHGILTARGRLAEADCRLVLLRGRHQVRRLFELSGLEGAFEFVSARDASAPPGARSPSRRPLGLQTEWRVAVGDQ